MSTIVFRGQPVDLLADPGLLDLDGAEILESELGIDLRDVGRLPRVRQLRALALISVRRVFPDATMAEVGRLNLMDVIDAVADVAVPQPAAVDPAVTNPRGIDFTGALHVPVGVGEPGEVLSPSSAGSETSAAALPASPEAQPQS